MRLFLLFLGLFFTSFVFSQDFQWVRQFDGSYFSDENASAIAVDDDGNSYTFGIIFDEIFDVDPTETGTQIIDNTQQSSTPHSSLFLTKLDNEGNFVWGITLGEVFGTYSATADRVRGMEIGTDGNLYLLADVYKQTSFLQKFITIFKIDPQGNILLTKEITQLNNPNQYDRYASSSLALDNQNNIYITGYYKHQFKIHTSDPSLNFVGSDSFLLKINNTTGDIIWGRVFDVLFTNKHFEKVKIDNNQNPILVVSNGDNQSYTNYGYNVFKINPNDGATIWGKFLDNQNPVTFNVDNTGNIIIAGTGKNFQGSNIDVDPSSDSHFISPRYYLLWLTNDGDFLDVKSYPILNSIYFHEIECDEENNTYIVGAFMDDFDVDPSENTYTLSYFCGGSNYAVAFNIKFDNNRNFYSAFQLGNYYNNYCMTFYFTDFELKNGNQYYVGNFSDTADFDPSENHYLLTTNNPFGARFTLKLGPCDSTTPIGNEEQIFCFSEDATIDNLYPNSDSINWYNSIDSTTPLENDVPLTNGQTYFASRQVGNCPESSERLEVLVTINPTSLEPQVLNQDLCYNSNLTLADINVQGANLSFYDSLTEENSLDIATPLNPDTVYYVTQNTTGCESNRVLIPLNLIITPVPTIDQQQNFCLIDNPSLYDIVVQGENIKWYNSNQIHLSGNTALTTSETLYLSQTIDDCESELFPVYVTITDTPIPQAETNQILCIDSNPTLNDVSINGENIKWYDENGNLLSQNTPITENRMVYATQTIDNCESQQITINITLQNSLNTNDYILYLCDEGNNNTENINLSDYNQFLINNGNTQNFAFSYYNNYQNALNSTNPITNFSAYQTTTEIIYVRVSSTTTTCFDISELSINLIVLPEIPLTESIYYLCGDNPLRLNIPKNQNIEYVWFNGSNNTSITISAEGEYWIKAIKTENGTSCESTTYFSVKRTEPIYISEIKIDDWTDNNNTITVLPYNENYIYSLNGQNFQNENYFENLSIGRYTVYVKDRGDCDEFSDVVYLLNYPRFFTPNGDSINDFWRVKFSQFQEAFDIEIYDRYGKLITVFDKNNIGWDGKLNGRDLPATDYWFKITRVSDRKIIYRGHFSLIR